MLTFMRINVSTLVLLSFLLLGTSLRAQWIPVQGMDGASCTAIHAIDSVLFVQADGLGMLSRPVDSAKWTVKSSLQLADFITAGSCLYGISWTNSYRSFDFGSTWDTIPQGTLHPRHLCSIGQTLFCSDLHSLFRSDDYGGNWYSISISLPGDHFTPMAHDTVLFCTENETDKIFISHDKGGSWNEVPTTGLPGDVAGLFDICEFGSTFWATDINSGIYRFSNTYQHWDLMSDTLVFSKFYVLDGSLYGLGYYGGIYRLSVNEDHWDNKSQGLGYSWVTGMAAAGSVLFCATSTGAYRASPEITWQDWSTGIHGGWIRNVSCLGDEVWVCSDNGLYKSNDHGSTFEKEENINRFTFRCLLTTHGYFLAGSGFVSASYDQGSSWVTSTAGLPSPCAITDLAAGDQYLYLIADGNLYRSAYDPVYWLEIKDSLGPFLSRIEAVDSTLLLASQSSTLLPYPVKISHDGGFTMDTVTCLNSGYFPVIRIEAGRFFILEYSPVWISEDQGYTWGSRPQIPDEFVAEAITATDACMATSGFRYGINVTTPKAYITWDDGYTWTDVVDNLAGCGSGSFTTVQASVGRLFLGSQSNGLWYRDDLLTGNLTHSSPADQSLKIFPNPAHDEISIKTEGTREPVTAELLITDMSGRIIMPETGFTLANSQVSGHLDISRLSPGIYFLYLRLSGGNRHFGKLIKY